MPLSLELAHPTKAHESDVKNEKCGQSTICCDYIALIPFHLLLQNAF